MALRALPLLICVGISFGDHIGVLQNDFDIKIEFTKLNQRFTVLEKDNENKADEIFRLKTIQQYHANAIIKLQTQTEDQRNKILHLEQKLKSFGKQTSEVHAEQEKTIGIIDELKLKCVDIVEMDHFAEANKTKRNRVQVRQRNVPQHEMANGSATSAILNEYAGIQKRSSGKMRKLVDGNQQVAFTALLSPHEYGPLGQGQIVKFDNVITNIGNAYHSHSGTFIATVDGVYMFFATIAGNQHSAGRNYVRFLYNGNRVTDMLVSSYDQSSQMFVLSLRTNDEIYLIITVANDVLLGDTYSSFSGVLLFSQ